MTLCRAALYFVACMFVPAQGQPCSCTGGCDSSNIVFPGSDGRIVDVAYGKSAHMSSTYYSPEEGTSGPACMAVNGKINTVFRTLNTSNPNCVHTFLGDIDAWWEVDLGRNHIVTNITIYRREGGGPENIQRRMSGIHVEVDSQTCYTFGPLMADNITALDDLPEKIDVTCTPPLTGRVVRLQKRGQERNYFGAGLINICEVQVWGCRADLYGRTCNSQCGQCKDSAPCDAVTGRCDVCQPNLLHPLCQECQGSRYGSSCDLQCSARCAGDGFCDRNTGQCQDGCQPGYVLGESGFCTDKAASSGDSQSLAGPIAGAVFGGLCVIALSIALSILIVGIIRRRSKQRSQSAPEVTMQGSAIQSGGSDNRAVISHQMTSSAGGASDNVTDEENHYYDELQPPDDSNRAPYSSPVFRNGNEIKKNPHIYANAST